MRKPKEHKGGKKDCGPAKNIVVVALPTQCPAPPPAAANLVEGFRRALFAVPQVPFTFHQIPLDGIDLNQGGWALSGGNLVVPADGVYDMSYTVNYLITPGPGMTINLVVLTQMTRNGTVIPSSRFSQQAFSQPLIAETARFFASLTAGDVLELQTLVTSAVTQVFVSSPNPEETYAASVPIHRIT